MIKVGKQKTALILVSLFAFAGLVAGFAMNLDVIVQNMQKTGPFESAGDFYATEGRHMGGR